MEKRRNRGGRHHGCGEPPMEGHHGGLPYPKNEESKEDRNRTDPDVAVQDPTGPEVEGAGQGIGPDDGQELEPYRGTEENPQVDPSGLPSFFGLVVGHQGEGAEGEHLIEEEQREEIPGEGHSHGCRDGHGKEQVEPRLVLFVMPPHVPDCIEGRHNPEGRRDQGKEVPKGFDFQQKGYTRDGHGQGDLGPASSHDLRPKGENHSEEGHTRS